MGNQINLQISSNADHADALAGYRGYTQAQADEVTNKYKANDMEFGLTLDALTTLLGDNDLAGKVLKSRRLTLSFTVKHAITFLFFVLLLCNI